jgi:hypothetical protein
MTKIAIIIGTDGSFESVLSDTEIDVQILQRGKHDNTIDRVENALEQVEVQQEEEE